MISGIYVLGPLMMTIGWTYLGGSTQLDVKSLVLATIIPLFTLYMAGPDVTMFGVLLSTLALTLIYVKIERS